MEENIVHQHLLEKLKVKKYDSLEFFCAFNEISRHFMVTNSDWCHFGSNLFVLRRLEGQEALEAL